MTHRAPLITVVIPTRERCDVLARSLHTVVSQDYANLRILVSDNCSADATRDVVHATRDPRVTYFNTGKRVSMSANWELALSQVARGWITIIGDDDGLLPGAIQRVADLAASTPLSAIKATRASYSWPSRTGTGYGRIRLPLGTGTELRSSRNWLRRLMEGQARYLDLPMLYDGGFVRSEVLDQLRARGAAVYRSSIPDVYSAVAIASIVDEYMFSHEPLAISGISAHSTGTSLLNGSKQDEETPIGKFQAEGNLPLHPAIPGFRGNGYPVSEQALVYECFLQSAFLREQSAKDWSDIDHEQQLVLIMTSAGKHIDIVTEWSQTFALHHHIDFERVTARASRNRRWARLQAAPRWVRANLELALDGDRTLPLRDVVEASTAMAALRSTGDGLFERASRLGRQILARVRRKRIRL